MSSLIPKINRYTALYYKNRYVLVLVGKNRNKIRNARANIDSKHG